MALKKSEQRLLIILGAVVAVFVFNQFVCGSNKKKPAKRRPARTASVNARSSQTEAVNETEISKKTYESWGRDPFLPKGAAYTRPKVTLRCQGMFWKSGKPYVLINNYVLSVGDTQGGITVDKIEGRRIQGRRDGKSFTLTWKG
ncbi:hypothetical protein HQ585_15385 [candidate division KSB1 bacterium]|nr:hypothetical protein [candidate division KSB1 bacterium]